MAGLLACGLNIWNQSSQDIYPSDFNGENLSADTKLSTYSCGGSCGFLSTFPRTISIAVIVSNIWIFGKRLRGFQKLYPTLKGFSGKSEGQRCAEGKGFFISFPCQFLLP